MIDTVFSQFSVAGLLQTAGKFGSGLINQTYLCEAVEGGVARRYILQSINSSVFRDPEQVMANLQAVTEHLARKLSAEGVPDPGSIIPVLVHTRKGLPYFRDESGRYWRMYRFIESGTVYDEVRDSGHAFEVGRALGRFQTLLSDLDPERLYDTLPGFHHTPSYLSAFDARLRSDPKGRADEARMEIEFVSRRRTLAPLLVDLIDSGGLPVRVVHNDPKVNNVMVHRDTGKALCMLDLDTVKPGIVHFDFGDCVRSASNPAGEDADLKDVAFDLEVYKAVAEGYLQEAGGFLTRREIEALPASVKVITFELGVRFLTDHLAGDAYFRTGYPGHNLHRSRVQFKLLEIIECIERKKALSV